MCPMPQQIALFSRTRLAEDVDMICLGIPRIPQLVGTTWCPANTPKGRHLTVPPKIHERWPPHIAQPDPRKVDALRNFNSLTKGGYLMAPCQTHERWTHHAAPHSSTKSRLFTVPPQPPTTPRKMENSWRSQTSTETLRRPARPIKIDNSSSPRTPT